MLLAGSDQGRAQALIFPVVLRDDSEKLVFSRSQVFVAGHLCFAGVEPVQCAQPAAHPMYSLACVFPGQE